MLKRLLILLLLLLGILAGGLFIYARYSMVQPAVFTLQQGASLKAAALQMKRAGVLGSDQPFVLLARLLGKTTQIKAGNYELNAPVTPLQLLDIISKGQVTLEQLSVIEGWTFRQLRAALDASPDLRHDTAELDEAEILHRLGAQEVQAEGLFFPDTYYFASGASDLDLLQRAYAAMRNHLRDNWATRDANLPLATPYQALILASIVEKETGVASDRSMIAGVFINRLKKDMLLQTDPAVIYGIGEKFDGNLRKRDLVADSPYNTYLRPGLPPTPIALPGLAALQAVLHPAQTDALYFVARGDGSSEFSKSLEQHNRAVNRYQK